MHQIFWLILIRMRRPLLVLVGVYSIAILGMVIVPGPVENDQVTRMDFFHAVYFVSYTSTTIGFGELPTAFSSSQRLWAMACIYMSVVSWIYSLGAILALVQDPAFRQAMTERNFARSVSKIKEPFYLLCGYGEAGTVLVHSLAKYNIRTVVIDIDEHRINELSLDDQRLLVHVPGLCADAGVPEHLLEAGLKSPSCSGVIALTDNDAVNLKISLTSKLLNPSLKVIATAKNQETKLNIASLGTEHVVDAFEIFGETIALSLHSPDQYLLREWLSGVANAEFDKPAMPPRGMWIVCGFGRLGRLLVSHLENEGLPFVVIEPNEGIVSAPHNIVYGRGTEAETLLEADVKQAVGIFAGTDNDPNNLSIIMTARELNPSLFIVARQNLGGNSALFEALDADIIMNPGHVLANNIRGLLTMPRLSEFLQRVSDYDNEWARELFIRLEKLIGAEAVPEIWEVKITEVGAPALLELLINDQQMAIEHLMTDAYNREIQLNAYPIYLVQDGQGHLMPEKSSMLGIDDKILFCGEAHAFYRMKLLLNDYYLLQQVVWDRDIPRSSMMRWMLGSDKQETS